jgi:hypothetical protein
MGLLDGKVVIVTGGGHGISKLTVWVSPVKAER